MSLTRLVYYSAVISGYAAFVGWLIAEMLFFRSDAANGLGTAVSVAAIVGGMIGLGLSLVAGMSNFQWSQLLRRGLPGMIGGGLGGALGGLLGNALYAQYPYVLSRVLGWLIVGLMIGVVDGLYERSKSRIRNGLIGGSLGGLLGGILFDPVLKIITSPSGMSSRALAFVILGLCIGALIGLAQVVFKDAWLTVLDGYRSGRQLILGQRVTILGQAEHLALPFRGPLNKELEPEHVRITRQPNGVFVVEDNHTKLGTRLNNQPLQHPTPLKNGDVIKFGTNFVRFNERASKDGSPIAAVMQPPGVATAAPPVPKRKSPSSAKPAADPINVAGRAAPAEANANPTPASPPLGPKVVRVAPSAPAPAPTPARPAPPSASPPPMPAPAAGHPAPAGTPARLSAPPPPRRKNS
jgi:hypothetical protein